MLLDLDSCVTQEAFGSVVGMSQQNVSDLRSRGVLREGGTVGQWISAYCAHLREQAAGRASTGDLQLAAERARLASEQADRVAMLNAQQRRELAPVALIEETLARVSRQVAGVLEGLPIQLRRASTSLTTDDLVIIEKEIVKARNAAASIEITWDDSDGHERDRPGDPVGAEAA